MYAISHEFSGAVAQAQETVRVTKESLAGWIAESGNEGGNTGDGPYLVEPRSFLVTSSMSVLCCAEGNRIDSKCRSFESFRSNLKSPEVLALDELVEQARNFPTPSSKRLLFTVSNRPRSCNRRRNPG